MPWLIGGSADLAPSTKTLITAEGAGELEAGNRGGRNLHFGIREHAMGAICNGLALTSLRVYGSTFLIFSDYMRPAIRLSAIMELPTIWIFTHDSIGVGEDGPTHQPVEQLISLRAVPGPDHHPARRCQRGCRSLAALLQMEKQPVCLILSRQPLPTLDRERYAPAAGVARGAYVLADPPEGQAPEVILIGTGSEISLCVQAYEELTAKGERVRVVSMPSCELFERQDVAYREQVLPPHVAARVAVEQATTIGWERYVGLTGAKIGMHSFGASAPLKELLGKFGFTPDKVAEAAREQIALGACRKGKVMNSLQQLGEVGQSVWLDNVSRGLIRKGELATLIERDGLKGVTSNPSIFEKAIGGSSDYDADLIAFARSTNADAVALYEHLAVGDIQEAADVLRPVFDAAGGRDGFISLEVSPYLANDTAGDRCRGTAFVGSGRPAEPDGQGAGHGGRGSGHRHADRRRHQHQRHPAVLAVVLRGGRPGLCRGPGNIGRGRRRRRRRVPAWPASSSAASIPPSMPSSTSASSPPAARSARTWSRFAARSRSPTRSWPISVPRRLFAGPRWERLAGKGAVAQRLLWASTGTKNKAYSDVLYVEELIGRDTVNTMPPATMDAFRDHGRVVADTIEADIEGARATHGDTRPSGHRARARSRRSWWWTGSSSSPMRPTPCSRPWSASATSALEGAPLHA